MYHSDLPLRLRAYLPRCYWQIAPSCWSSLGRALPKVTSLSWGIPHAKTDWQEIKTSSSHQFWTILKGRPSSRALLARSSLRLHPSLSSPLFSPTSFLSCPQVSTSRACFLHVNLHLRACFLEKPTSNSPWKQILKWDFGVGSSSAWLAIRTHHWHKVEVKQLNFHQWLIEREFWWKRVHKTMWLIRHLRNVGQITTGTEKLGGCR